MVNINKNAIAAIAVGSMWLFVLWWWCRQAEACLTSPGQNRGRDVDELPVG